MSYNSSFLIYDIKNEIATVESQIYELETLPSQRQIFNKKGNIFIPANNKHLLDIKKQFVCN
jgi:chaperonin cofactor prefoldin